MSTTTRKDRMRTLLNALKAQDRLKTAKTTFQTEVTDLKYRSLSSLGEEGEHSEKKVRTVKVDDFETAIEALRITPPTDKLIEEQYKVVERLVDEISKCRECLESNEVEALERQPKTIAEESSEPFAYLTGKQARDNLAFTDTLLKQKLEAVSASAERDECSFCFEALGDDTTTLHCNHKFHKDCMRQWLVMAPAPTCPLCRDSLGYLLATPDFQTAAERRAHEYHEPINAGYRPSLADVPAYRFSVHNGEEPQPVYRSRLSQLYNVETDEPAYR